jgi:hypothetical protein
MRRSRVGWGFTPPWRKVPNRTRGWRMRTVGWNPTLRSTASRARGRSWQRATGACGSAGIGNTTSAMRTISGRMSGIVGSTRSNTDWWSAPRIGRIRRITGMEAEKRCCRVGLCPPCDGSSGREGVVVCAGAGGDTRMVG